METKNKIEKQNIHKGHRKRLRKTFSLTEVCAMPEHQLLELMLSYVQPLKDVNPVAHHLISEFGSLANVFDSNIEDLKRVKGVGEVTASFINFCAKLPEIYKSSKSRTKTLLETPSQFINFFKETVEVGAIEKFYFVCLNSKGEILCFKNFGSGSVTKLYINRRDFVQNILKYPTHSVVICHTHANGKPLPSEEDITFTKSLNAVLTSLNIRLCDHVIISPDGQFSFYQNNLLNSHTSREFDNLKMNLFDFGLFSEENPKNKN